MKGLTNSRPINAIFGKPANYRGQSTTKLGRKTKKSGVKA